MSNIDSILKGRDITLPTKVHLVKAMAFLVVMYGYFNREWNVIHLIQNKGGPNSLTLKNCLQMCIILSGGGTRAIEQCTTKKIRKMKFL